MSLSDAIRRFAEEPDFELPEAPLPTRRFIRPNFTLVLAPTPSHAALTRVRTTARELDATIAEVRALLREHNYVGCSWYVGPSCRPDGLTSRLVERGFVPATRPPFEPLYTAMLLTRPPPPRKPAPGIEARVVHNFDEFVSALRTGLEGINEAPEDIARWVDAAPAYWAHENGVAKQTHIAYVDGKVAGLGFFTPGPSAVLLGGSAVLPAFRGRGVYRALVASRWEEAVKMGRPALTVHAGAMSRPILERCGFEEICRLDVLADPTLE
ncbi:MAG TPA: GNAT family N-acetyltransferase [Polyangia bacterium]|nr:GNAT family N-acetyltransferase [Polyangia bacterium]